MQELDRSFWLKEISAVHGMVLSPNTNWRRWAGKILQHALQRLAEDDVRLNRLKREYGVDEAWGEKQVLDRILHLLWGKEITVNSTLNENIIFLLQRLTR